MCEITIGNFHEKYAEIESTLKQSKFISIDIEFSALDVSEGVSKSLFDTLQQRYIKMKATVEQSIPIQIGLTAFDFNADLNKFIAKTFTFYICPRSFGNLDKVFVFQSSSLQFLCYHNFDFNKFIYQGIPYLNKVEERQLRKSINDKTSPQFVENNLEHCLDDNTQDIDDWLTKKDSTILLIPDFQKLSFVNRYLLHKQLRSKYLQLWTYDESGEFKIKMTDPGERKRLEKESNIDEIFLQEFLGFTRIFRLLASLRKPLIGHNLFTDLMMILHNFNEPLPKSYNAFKQTVHSVFPEIYDTKTISFEIFYEIPKEKRWNRNYLEHLYIYFKDKHGRHLAINSPHIENQDVSQNDQFHDAGWDSYCTGYIFIRMAHFYSRKKYTASDRKVFMSCELLGALSEYKNSLNVIKGALRYIKLDGKDPASTRPPWMILENKSNEPINVEQVLSLLSPYGYVEVAPCSTKSKKALIAVDNFGSARRILNQFKVHDDVRIQPYNILKHSEVARTALWSGVLVSAAVLLWVAFKKV